MNDILKSAQPLDACAYPEIPAVAACLRNGGVAVLPTETVYGLGAVYNNISALASVFEIKNRPRFDPLIVHIADLEQINDLAAEIPPVAWALAKILAWPVDSGVVKARLRTRFSHRRNAQRGHTHATASAGIGTYQTNRRSARSAQRQPLRWHQPDYRRGGACGTGRRR